MKRNLIWVEHIHRSSYIHTHTYIDIHFYIYVWFAFGLAYDYANEFEFFIVISSDVVVVYFA